MQGWSISAPGGRVLLLDAYLGHAGVATAFLCDSVATRSGHETPQFVPTRYRPLVGRGRVPTTAAAGRLSLAPASDSPTTAPAQMRGSAQGRSDDEVSGQSRNASRSGHLTETNSRVLASGGCGFATLRASPGRRRRLVFQLDNLELDDQRVCSRGRAVVSAVPAS